MKSFKRKDVLIPIIDSYIVSAEEESDRLRDVNAPSTAGACLRASYYRRTGAVRDTPEARAQRIFKNGDYVHLRIQEYLTKAGILLMDEAPLRNDKYDIQGHTDGILRLSGRNKLDIELAVLEIKSINDRGFNGLKKDNAAKEAHLDQANVYLFCLRKRQEDLWNTYEVIKDFEQDKPARHKYYASLYKHLRDGKKYTAKEKLDFKISQHEQVDRILYEAESFISHVIFIYEDKDNQELMEFVVKYDHERMKVLLKDFQKINQFVKAKKIPERMGSGKADIYCKWCDYKALCWD